MMRVVLILVFFCLTIGLARAQSNSVMLQVTLSPIQILEVDHGDRIDFSTVVFANKTDPRKAEMPDYLNSYSTSPFVLKIDFAAPLLSNEKPTSEDFISRERDDENRLQIMYSMEAL